jgi:hypothetical protein
MSIARIVETIRSQGFVLPAVSESLLHSARSRNVPPDVLEFYSMCDGVYIGEGDDFVAPNGRRYRFRIPRLSDLQTVREYGFIPDDAPLFGASSMWWQILDYCDGNWLAVDATPEGNGRILDIFHETVGEAGSHNVVAASLVDMLERLATKRSTYWLREGFMPLGIV